MDNKFTPWCEGLMGYESNSCSWIKYEFFWVLKEIYPKIYGNVDMTLVANEIVLRGGKKESSTSVHTPCDAQINYNTCKVKKGS